MSGAAMAAEGLSYTYGELDVVNRDIDVFDDDEDAIEDFDDGGGWAVRGSIAVTDNFFVFGSYSDTESDVTFVSDQVFLIPSEENTKQFQLGVGLNLGLGERADFVGRLGYNDLDFGDFDFGADEGTSLGDLRDDSSDGFSLDLGVRSQLMPNLEGSIGARYLDIEDRDNTSLVGRLMFELSNNWGVNVELDAGDEISTAMLGVRWIAGER